MEVEILGHKAKIQHISSQLKQEPFYKEDHLVVWLAFDEAVGSVLSFAIYVPAKKYADREELLYNIRRHGQEDLKRMLAKDEERRREFKETQQRQKALNDLAAEAQKLIE